MRCGTKCGDERTVIFPKRAKNDSDSMRFEGADVCILAYFCILAVSCTESDFVTTGLM